MPSAATAITARVNLRMRISFSHPAKTVPTTSPPTHSISASLAHVPAEALEELDHVDVRPTRRPLHPDLAGAVGRHVRLEGAALHFGRLLLGSGLGELGVQEATVAGEP